MRRILIAIWRFLDPFYYNISNLQYIKYGENIFRVKLTKYKGYPITLLDGTSIHKNDLLLKVHFHNVKLLTELQSIRGELQRGKAFYKQVKDSLPGLALYLKQHAMEKQIKGLIGITALDFGTKRLGFERFPIKNTYYKLYKKISFLTIYLLSSSFHSKNQNHKEPAYIFISKSTLFQYLSSNPKPAYGTNIIKAR